MSGYIKTTVYKVGDVLGAMKMKWGVRYYTYAFGGGEDGYKRTKRQAFEFAQRKSCLYKLADGEWDKIKSNQQIVNF